MALHPIHRTEKSVLFDPIGNYNTKDIESEFDSDKLSSRSMTGSLRCPHWCYRIQNAGPDTIQYTSCEYLVKEVMEQGLTRRTAKHPIGILGGTLKSGTSNCPYRGNGYGQDTPISVTEPSSKECAKQSAW